jgi:tRNA threonylcarbamoyladenosine biosynthesis protein TsaE
MQTQVEHFHEYVSHSVADTERMAAELAQSLRGGDVIALHGELGAGKTQFTRGIVKALGGNPQLVSSPTYVLMHIYPAPVLKIYHIDAYRVGGSDDLAQIGFDELLIQKGIILIEWASRITSLLPDHTIHITLEPAK